MGVINTSKRAVLSATYSDSVTGFSGTCTARCEYLASNPRVLLERISEGKVQAEWFDEARLDFSTDNAPRAA